ncbi:hypothetical protein [Chitinasiproducens palmae]|uniref:Uncharacterized protein n=1 Tax=Chitinasiproducens palmae TaxID=1770053 RepID=A0A1H2PS32_9BURK|nr:hypothetical protein [Chitinasiproducens palmae]SDV49763.1 hypothetical protein SAMN05216551_109115 [Chitinasiproducens palmae]
MKNPLMTPEEGAFMTSWAQRLADRMRELLPVHVLAQAKVLSGMAGIELRAKRIATLARFEHPLRVFVALRPNEIKAFLSEPLQNTERLRQALGERIRRCTSMAVFDAVDFGGGSQRARDAVIVRLDELGVEGC